MRVVALALLLLVLVDPALTFARGARPAPAQRALDAAERLFRRGLYRETLRQLELVPGDPELRARVWLLGALASYKLDELARADQLASQVLARGFSAEAALLRGMVAFRRGQWERSLGFLREVVAAGEPPWDEAAFTLMGEVESEQRAARTAYDAAIGEAKQQIGAGQLERAERALERAERLLPGEVSTRYYRGLLAYQRRQYQAAERWLQAAIALDRRDSWSAYMLALTQGELGDPRGARARLAALARSAHDPAVRRTATRALEVMRRSEGASRHHLDLHLEAGTALDTNPSFVNESSASLEDAGLALHVAGRASYKLRATERIYLGAGVRFLERAYGVGGAGAAVTELDPALTLLMIGRSFRVGVSMSFPFQLYGHEPFSFTPGGELHASLSLRSWLFALLGVRAANRMIQNADYQHLQAVMLGGWLGLRASWPLADLELSYFAQRSGAEEVTKELGAYRLATDYTAWAHGPRLALLARLPLRLRLYASVGFALHHFASSDLLVRTDGTASERLPSRFDGALGVEAELARSLPAGLEVALRYESVDNFSTLVRREAGLDYNYTRRLAGLVLGWTWPMRQGP